MDYTSKYLSLIDNWFLVALLSSFYLGKVLLPIRLLHYVVVLPAYASHAFLLFDIKDVRFDSQRDWNLIETESKMLISENICLPDLSQSTERRRLTVMCHSSAHVTFPE